MKVKLIKLIQYRNYQALTLQPHERLTVLLGENAQGKTNVAEAVYLCAAGRSHRTSKEGELIMWEKEGAYVRVDVQRENMLRKIEMRLPKNGRKQVKVDASPLSRMGELMGVLNCVMFSPEDLRMVKDGPGERRRFMDMELSQLRPAYFYTLGNYQRALAQRNALLKEISFGRGREEDLVPWEELLIQNGEKIWQMRRVFLEKLRVLAENLHYKISGGKEKLELFYQSDLNGGEYAQKLIENRQEDLRRGITGRGIHKDDIQILLGGIDARTFGSQGQQRTAALSMKLSELQLMESVTGEKPVLLLDDVMSELDEKRQDFLLNSIEDCQTILTCTQLPPKVYGDVYRVSAGSMEKMR
jgi:DNA replication and repair protein RecF